MTNEQMKQLNEINDSLSNSFKLVQRFEEILAEEPHWSPDIDSIKSSLSQAREFLDGDISRMKQFMKDIDND
jgi:hypothetical protein